MNRQVALAYASAGVAASVAAIVVIGSAFGFAPNTPETASEWDAEATATADPDYESQQAAYERSLEEYRQGQAAAAQAQIDADWQTVLAQRDAAQGTAAAEVAAQREAALQDVEAQIAAQQAAAAAELQAWLDEQRQAALDALAAEIEARDQQALDDLTARLGETQAAAAPASPTTVTVSAPTAPTAAPTLAPTPAPTPSSPALSEHQQELQKKIAECEQKQGEAREECFDEVAKMRREFGL